VPEPTLYLFDGYNLLNAGEFRGRDDLVDRLAGFVALKGARGVVVFDGAGDDVTFGALEVRFAERADPLLERLAAEHRDGERVLLVSSDRDLRTTAGHDVRRRASRAFAAELAAAAPSRPADEQRGRARIEDALDPQTRARLERWRRRRS
jgi:predicted RNA-binding protein with PIN domain